MMAANQSMALIKAAISLKARDHMYKANYRINTSEIVIKVETRQFHNMQPLRSQASHAVGCPLCRLAQRKPFA